MSTKKKNKKTKEHLLKTLGNICQICGKDLPSEKLALEHIFPKSKGGKDNKENLSIVCFSCNSKKGKNTSATYPLKSLLENKDFFINLCKYEKKNFAFTKEITLKNLKEYREKLKRDIFLINSVIKEIEKEF
ncbi:HNH endonuclease [Fusobacterium vincentii]|uniref:HNH endonuclease n=1 Tax=Fusobacterium vincentii TaxID=155615 RepID=A0AAJ1FUE3_FUSVC|nr:HNH endonuclease [Fusobacterium vincentii]MCW0263089.1 HNH endonuclease [Fusobacterium vincentii]STO29921.1 Uncharacterized protein conserved in bacteria [Fusobacterium vincentii]